MSQKWDNGFIDDEIMPFLKTVNEFEGVETLSSCAGHGPDGEGRKTNETGESDGHVWFRSTPFFTDQLLGIIASWPGVWWVSRVWGRQDGEAGTPLVEVLFKTPFREEVLASLVEVLRPKPQPQTQTGPDA